ncbi:hypothetical protein D9M71_687130 [compost metagenome]
MASAAQRNTQGANCLITPPNGASNTANRTDSGTAINAANAPPVIILRKAICGTPSLRK